MGIVYPIISGLRSNIYFHSVRGLLFLAVRTLEKLFDLYIPIVDHVSIFDNSFGTPIVIAKKAADSEIEIINQNKFNQLKQYYDNRRKQ